MECQMRLLLACTEVCSAVLAQAKTGGVSLQFLERGMFASACQALFWHA